LIPVQRAEEEEEDKNNNIIITPTSFISIILVINYTQLVIFQLTCLIKYVLLRIHIKKMKACSRIDLKEKMMKKCNKIEESFGKHRMFFC